MRGNRMSRSRMQLHFLSLLLLIIILIVRYDILVNCLPENSSPSLSSLQFTKAKVMSKAEHLTERMNKAHATSNNPILDPERTRAFVVSEYNSSVIPVLSEFIKIPNLSPTFDSEVLTNGKMDLAIDLIVNWIASQGVEGLRIEMVQDTDGVNGTRSRTPIIFIEIDATSDVASKNDTVLMYGHMDKQPPFTGWRPGLGPYTPVIGVYDKDPTAEVLYGRGGADNGYALFSSIVAIKALKQQNVSHHRIVMIIEASEESGSIDLMYHMESLKPKIGNPSLIVCMDSSIGDYERMWLVTSLRGIVVGTLSVSLLSEGVHSGSGSGIVADSFRVARHLLSRLEDETTGEIKLKALHTKIPEQKIEQARATAQVLGIEGIFGVMPTLPGVQPVVNSDVEMLLGGTWRPAMVITGASGLPTIDIAGNVLRPETTLKFSIRIPPTVDPQAAKKAVKELLEKGPIPYGAHVKCDVSHATSGWSAPNVKNWLKSALVDASSTYYGKESVYRGSGGSIGSINTLGKAYPSAQFVITGVMGPNSNAHSSNEMLHIPYAQKLTMSISEVLARHAVAPEEEEEENSSVSLNQMTSSALGLISLCLCLMFSLL